ncbi:unnamed protein product [Acanthosepion pharaonis]|uniref:Uncharacterized protein n=1 Tax=Acanthosepion pharaonis TaxID=158019 RepID=A0A812BDR7_ACAPH|nr:unnamed protein product [Sepia pharaonis]
MLSSGYFLFFLSSILSLFFLKICSTFFSLSLFTFSFQFHSFFFHFFRFLAFHFYLFYPHTLLHLFLHFFLLPYLSAKHSQTMFSSFSQFFLFFPCLHLCLSSLLPTSTQKRCFNPNLSALINSPNKNVIRITQGATNHFHFTSRLGPATLAS